MHKFLYSSYPQDLTLCITVGYKIGEKGRKYSGYVIYLQRF